MKYHLEYQAGSSPSMAAKQSQALMYSNIGRQAFIEGINDDFLLAGIITLIGGIPIIFLHTKKSKNQNQPVHE